MEKCFIGVRGFPAPSAATTWGHRRGSGYNRNWVPEPCNPPGVEVLLSLGGTCTLWMLPGGNSLDLAVGPFLH